MNIFFTIFNSLIDILLVVLPLFLIVAYTTYSERKIIGFMQSRMGPTRVGPYGILQPIADIIKLLSKEIIIPSNANKGLFLTAPMIMLVPSLLVWSVIPLSEYFVIANINAGLLFILALTSLSVYGVILAGWASNSKYAFLGSMRSAAQIIAYEIAMGFALVGVLMAAGSLNLQEIIISQKGGIINWYWLPLFPLFIIYLISGIAETNRAPFDVSEGESEIVAGFHVEYSGVAFAMFFLAEYMNLILISVLVSIMFFGGWLSPFESTFLEYYFIWIPDFAWLAIKTLFFIFLFLWLRATLPRYRYDQIMRLGWKVFLPITLAWIFLEGFMIYYKIQPWFSG
jgi:NADH-quinone oxidoreductase subunit H